MKIYKINTCDICVGLMMKFEYDCPFSKQCRFEDPDNFLEASNNFGNFIEEQVQEVKKMLNEGVIQSKEELEIEYIIRPKNKN